MSALVDAALALWGLGGAQYDFVTGRENEVYRVQSGGAVYALRLRRPGYRTIVELRSELQWLDAMFQAGLSVPRPVAARSGDFLGQVGHRHVDVLHWLDGQPLGENGKALALRDGSATFFRLGRDIARLHIACDRFSVPSGFNRWRWDVDGLVGATPVWGRFWENPTLDQGTRALFVDCRDAARGVLADHAEDLDFGLIHADLVRENVLLDGGRTRFLDFDDGGFGYRLFDLATVLLNVLDEPGYPDLKAALIRGYEHERSIDVSLLEVFLMLRALTYVGWIVPRLSEDGAQERNARFSARAARLCSAHLGSR